MIGSLSNVLCCKSEGSKDCVFPSHHENPTSGLQSSATLMGRPQGVLWCCLNGTGKMLIKEVEGKDVLVVCLKSAEAYLCVCVCV